MSKAIYSEIVELVLTVDKFESRIKDAISSIDRIQSVAKQPIVLSIDTKAAALNMLAARTSMETYRKEIEATDKAIQQLLLRQERQVTLRRDAKGGVTSFGEYNDSQRVANASRFAQAYAEQLRFEKQLLDITKERSIAAAQAARATTGYNIGSTVLGGKTGAAFTAAASGSFFAGANNLGAMFYMMERMSYATGIGQRKLGEFAEKLNLVKMTGDGAEISIAKFGNALMTAGKVAGVAGAAVGAMFAGNKLDKALADMSTLLADVSVKGMVFDNMIQNASVSAAKLSKAFGEDIVTVVNGFKTALSTGINADELEEFGNTALNMSKGLGATFEQSIAMLTTFKDAFAGSLDDVKGYSDVVFNAINVGKFNVEQLNANIGRVAVSAAEAGVSFKDMMAALSTLNRVGMSTSQAITSLNQMIVSIVNPSDKAKKTFDSLGIAYGSAALRGRSLLAVIDEIKTKVGGNADLYGEMFSEERGRRGAIGLAANPALFEANRAEMEKTGTAAAAAARAMDTFGQNLYKTFLPVWNVIQQIGEAMLNVINQLYKGADTTFEWSNAFATAVALVGNGLTVLTGIVVSIIKVFELLATTVMDLSRIVQYVLTGRFIEAAATVNKMVDNIATNIKSIGSTIAVTARGVGTVWESIYSTVVTTTTAATTAAVQTTKNAFDSLKDSVVSSTAVLTSDVAKLFTDMSDKAVSSIQKIADAQAELARKAFINKFNTEYLANNKPSSTNADDSEIRARNNLATVQSQLADSTLDATNKAFLERYKSQLEASIAAKKRIRDEAYAKELKQIDDDRKKRLNEALVAEGFTPESKVIKGADKTSVGTDYGLNSRMRVITDIMTTFDVLEKRAKNGSADAIDDYTKQIDELKRRYDDLMTYIVDNTQTMSSETAKLAGAQLKATGDAIEENEKKLATLKENNYKREYNASLSLYNAKHKFFVDEANKLKELGKAYDEFISKTKGSSMEREYDIRGPGYARRQYKERIEQGITAASTIKDPEKALDAFKKLDELIEKMVSAGDADGSGGRAMRDAKDFQDAIIELANQRRKEVNATKDMFNQQDRKAYNDFKTQVADNPVAQAAMQYADTLVKDTLKEAAKNGISVNGEFVSNVELKIDAQVPIEGLRDAVLKTVRAEMTRVYEDMLKEKNPSTGTPGSNTNPNGI